MRIALRPAPERVAQLVVADDLPQSGAEGSRQHVVGQVVQPVAHRETEQFARLRVPPAEELDGDERQDHVCGDVMALAIGARPRLAEGRSGVVTLHRADEGRAPQEHPGLGDGDAREVDTLAFPPVAESLRVAPDQAAGPGRPVGDEDVVAVAGHLVSDLLGDLHAEKRLAGEEPGALLKAAFRLSDRIVFSKLRERTGGRIRFFVSGAAPLSAEIARFFYSGDLVILEGYGLTESSPVTNVNPPDDIRFGTVGPPIPGTRIRIADDGEILMNGPQIMKGYFGDPEATKSAIDAGGWLHSGDIGHLDDDGYLTITDRKKNLIVTAAGKNIAPQPIEERIARSPFVDQVVVLGDKRKFPIMLVVPSFQAYRVALPGKIVTDEDRHEHRDSRALRELLESDISPRIAGLARYERPKRTLIVSDTFSVANGMLTPTLKVKRREIAARYADRIDQLYAEAEADAVRS